MEWYLNGAQAASRARQCDEIQLPGWETRPLLEWPESRIKTKHSTAKTAVEPLNLL